MCTLKGSSAKRIRYDFFMSIALTSVICQNDFKCSLKKFKLI